MLNESRNLITICLDLLKFKLNIIWYSFTCSILYLYITIGVILKKFLPKIFFIFWKQRNYTECFNVLYRYANSKLNYLSIQPETNKFDSHKNISYNYYNMTMGMAFVENIH